MYDSLKAYGNKAFDNASKIVADATDKGTKFIDDTNKSIAKNKECQEKVSAKVLISKESNKDYQEFNNKIKKKSDSIVKLNENKNELNEKIKKIDSFIKTENMIIDGMKNELAELLKKNESNWTETAKKEVNAEDAECFKQKGGSKKLKKLSKKGSKKISKTGGAKKGSKKVSKKVSKKTSKTGGAKKGSKKISKKASKKGSKK